MGEFDFIRWIRKQSDTAYADVLLGPGDDAAIVNLSEGRHGLLTVDMLMDGVDFIVGKQPAALIGRKALAVNLSDIAAMAGRPTSCLISLALPEAGGLALAKELFQGINELAREFGVVVAGGDTNSWNGPLVISITVFGETPKRGALLRSTAKPGDRVLVTGTLGGSIAGRHLRFTPRVKEAQLLYETYHDLHAMIDLSDGLAGDLGHILEESHCGARLCAASLPLSEEAKSATDGRSPLEHALRDGEDFELCFTAPPATAAKIVTEQPLTRRFGVAVTDVGKITSESGMELLLADGSVKTLETRGFEHKLT